jgi:molybdopterin synthase sulfur carrier subunit
MAVKVMIPTPLRVYAGKRDSAEFTAATVGEALGHLTTQFGDLRKHLFTEDGKLRSFVNVYVNDEDIRYHQHRPLHRRRFLAAFARLLLLLIPRALGPDW